MGSNPTPSAISLAVRPGDIGTLQMLTRSVFVLNVSAHSDSSSTLAMGYSGPTACSYRKFTAEHFFGADIQARSADEQSMRELNYFSPPLLLRQILDTLLADPLRTALRQLEPRPQVPDAPIASSQTGSRQVAALMHINPRVKSPTQPSAPRRTHRGPTLAPRSRPRLWRDGRSRRGRARASLRPGSWWR